METIKQPFCPPARAPGAGRRGASRPAAGRRGVVYIYIYIYIYYYYCYYYYCGADEFQYVYHRIECVSHELVLAVTDHYAENMNLHPKMQDAYKDHTKQMHKKEELRGEESTG